jgi:hypothetical protein
LWNTTNATTQVTNYITAAILAEQLVTLNPTSTNAEMLSYAIWDVFVPTASSTLSSGNQSIINTYLNGAKAQANNLVTNSASLQAAASGFANVLIYTADPKSGGAVTYCPPGAKCGAPQEFLVVSMAEPSAPILLLIDLLAVFSLVFFFRNKRRGISIG